MRGAVLYGPYDVRFEERPAPTTCPNCRYGYQTSCLHKELVRGAQAPFLRVPLADGTLVATPEVPSHDLVPYRTMDERRAIKTLLQP